MTTPLPDDQNRPPDEAWWEQELFRNEKLVDKYLAVFEQTDDWRKWENPEDLYNKVHYGIDPPDRPADERTAGDSEIEEEFTADGGDDAIEAEDGSDDLANVLEEEPVDNADYREIAERAFNFGLRVLQSEWVAKEEDVLRTSAAKIAANLAGGHGLGYREETLCGNIVKCRSALAEAEFCHERLEFLLARPPAPEALTELADLLAGCRTIRAAIAERISRLRSRVWW